VVSELEKVLLILSLSNRHENWTVKDIQRLVIPPLKLNQYRIYIDEEVPLCYASWAMLPKEADEGYKNKTRKIQPKDWDSGNNLWLVDVICPFGGTRSAIKRLDTLRKELGLPDKVNFYRGKRLGSNRVNNVTRI
jgi:cytolysin-activating lysine-acyltransferase